jgi:hypothetical protein
MEFCRSGRRPDDVPSSPEKVYKDIGWISLGDWFGTGYVFNRKWRPFAEARAFARSLNLSNHIEWMEFCRSGRRPDDIPSAPQRTYIDNGWIDWADWFGTGSRKNHQWRPFAEARAFARSLGLSSGSEWREYCRSGKHPDDIPRTPDTVFKENGWIGWGDWLGTGNLRNRRWRSFDEARAFAQALKLKGSSEWVAYAKTEKRPPDIPSNPHTTYKANDWKGYGDWLGTDNIAPQHRQWRPFDEARAFARSLGLLNAKNWEAFCRSGKCPDDIPRKPGTIYKCSDWKGYGDWLGTGNISNRKRQWRPFDEARAFARSLKLSSGSEWREYCRSGKRPDDMPSNPEKTYRDSGWISWSDWLGTDRTRVSKSPKRKS